MNTPDQTLVIIPVPLRAKGGPSLAVLPTDWSRELIQRVLQGEKEGREIHEEQAAVGELFMLNAVNAPEAGPREAVTLHVRRVLREMHLVKALGIKGGTLDLSAFHKGTPTQTMPALETKPHEVIDPQDALRRSLMGYVRTHIDNPHIYGLIFQLLESTKAFKAGTLRPEDAIHRMDPRMADHLLPLIRTAVVDPSHRKHHVMCALLREWAQGDDVLADWSKKVLGDAEKSAN